MQVDEQGHSFGNSMHVEPGFEEAFIEEKYIGLTRVVEPCFASKESLYLSAPAKLEIKRLGSILFNNDL